MKKAKLHPKRGRPPTGIKTVTITLTLPIELKEKLDKVVKSEYMSRSSAVVYILNQWLKD